MGNILMEMKFELICNNAFTRNECGNAVSELIANLFSLNVIKKHFSLNQDGGQPADGHIKIFYCMKITIGTEYPHPKSFSPEG